MRRAVSITGAGVLSPAGCDWPTFAATLREGRAANPAPFDGVEGAPVCHRISDPAALDAAPVQEGEPLGRLASTAVRDALAMAGICADGRERLDDVGLVMSTALGPSTAVEAYLERLREKGPRAARPAQFVDTLLSMAASRTGIALGLRGSTSALAGSSAIEVAFDWVRSGREHTVVAGGADYLSPKCLRYLAALAGRSNARRAVPAQAAAFLLLEASDHAGARGAQVLGEVLGTGGASGPQEATVPWHAASTGAAFGLAMEEAMSDAGVAASDVAAVVLAAGDDTSEAYETTAVASAFGAGLRLLRPKRIFGEPLAAGEGLGLLAALALGEPGSLVVVNSLEMGGAVTSCVVRCS